MMSASDAVLPRDARPSQVFCYTDWKPWAVRVDERQFLKRPIVIKKKYGISLTALTLQRMMPPIDA
jgi:hypothetical protein